ncbi:MAG: TRAP transporter substrate-binding protein DctP [Myxococcota bacterium]
MALSQTVLGAAMIAAAGLTALMAPRPAAAADKVVIKLGTLAPEGSEWHNTLVRMGQRWKEASGGAVELKIYPGGVAGDEGDMVRKIRIGQLHAATITGIGLGTIHRSTIALQVPMMIESWEELDYIRAKLGPEMEKELDDQGFVVTSWGDAGWVHFFGTKPGATPDDYRKMKLFVWTGDPEAERVWRDSKFTPVALASTEVMPALQTGMVEAFQTAPLFALTSQWYKSAKYMVKVNWTPLNGATIVAKKQWEKIDPKYREELLKISREEGDKLKLAVRQMSDKAIDSMVERGLKVTVPDAATVEAWKKTAELAYPSVRGKVVPEKYFDRVQALAKEYRAQQKK